MNGRMILGLGVAAIVAAAEPATTQQLAHIITQPDWRTRPTADELALAYPQEAVSHHLDGHVVIHCRVRISGNLTDCDVVEEAPAGYGFGASALKMAEHFDMKPLTDNGAPSDEGEINVPISFREPKPILITQPEPLPPGSSWFSCPSDGKSLGRYYPKKAQKLNVEGGATIQCRLSPTGAATECAWLKESPPDLGFGEAAQKLGCLMKFKRTATADASEQLFFKAPIRFRLPPS